MIGNSPRSDILPARKVGMNAVFIPNDHTWSFFRMATDRMVAGLKHAGCHVGGLAVAVAGAACVGLDQLNTVVTEAG